MPFFSPLSTKKKYKKKEKKIDQIQKKISRQLKKKGSRDRKYFQTFQT